MAHYRFRGQFEDATALAMIDKPKDRTVPAMTLIERLVEKPRYECLWMNY
jgi:hypothetical protein